MIDISLESSCKADTREIIDISLNGKWFMNLIKYYPIILLVCLFGFYGISTFVSYLIPIQFLNK